MLGNIQFPDDDEDDDDATFFLSDKQDIMSSDSKQKKVTKGKETVKWKKLHIPAKPTSLIEQDKKAQDMLLGNCDVANLLMWPSFELVFLDKCSLIIL